MATRGSSTMDAVALVPCHRGACATKFASAALCVLRVISIVIYCTRVTIIKLVRHGLDSDMSCISMMIPSNIHCRLQRQSIRMDCLFSVRAPRTCMCTAPSAQQDAECSGASGGLPAHSQIRGVAANSGKQKDLAQGTRLHCLLSRGAGLKSAWCRFDLEWAYF